MRAALYARDQRFVVEDRVPEPPGPGQIQINVAYAGICGTDLHIRQGDMDARVPTPAILGHEASGRIAALGAGVDAGWQVGDPVTVMPLVWCGRCAACRAGHTHVCQRLQVIGVDLPGAMQGRWNVPSSVVVRLPGHLPLDHAALVEPTAVAVHDVRRSGLTPDERAVIVGGGPIGLLIGRVATSQGSDVVLVEPDPHRRGVAEQLGLTTLDPTGIDVESYVDDWTAGDGVPVAFEVSGAAAGVRTAERVLGVRGRLVVVAIHPEPVPVDLNRVFLRELSVVGTRVYTRASFEYAVELLSRGEIPVPALISSVVPLSDVVAAFDALASGGGVVKVLLDCQAG
ncbi:MAG TPA: alcohol dehydrogenase catalytic domain-containing protein [Actinopolymorphaceae bacterium]|nr:alcohol dehydrogenase catalytic domain-containing protein [Actinopolymorphaceae bacterium]